MDLKRLDTRKEVEYPMCPISNNWIKNAAHTKIWKELNLVII